MCYNVLRNKAKEVRDVASKKFFLAKRCAEKQKNGTAVSLRV